MLPGQLEASRVAEARRLILPEKVIREDAVRGQAALTGSHSGADGGGSSSLKNLPQTVPLG